MAIIYNRKVQQAGAFERLGTTEITVTAHSVEKGPAIIALALDGSSVACRAHITPAAARAAATLLIAAAQAAEESQAVAA